MTDERILEDALVGIRRRLGPIAPPGMALAVTDGERTAHVVDGVRARAGTLPGLESDLPVTPHTAFDLASVTKAVGTTASLVRLVGEGALAVDDRVRAIVPSAPVDAGTTLRDLLLHRAGLWEWWPLYLPEPTDRAATYARLDALPFRYPPGEGRHYSDLGFILLGRVIESVTQGSLADAVGRLVTEPLGLKRTRFAHPVGDDVAANAPDGDAIEQRMIASGEPYPVPTTAGDFAGWRSTTISGEVSDGNAFHAFRGDSGHAGLFCTVPELLRIGSALAGEGFAPTAVREAFATPGPDPEQALGFRTDELRIGDRRLPMLWHPGYTGMGVGWVPGTGIAVVFASNRLHAAGLGPGRDPANTVELWRAGLVAAGEWLAARGFSTRTVQ